MKLLQCRGVVTRATGFGADCPLAKAGAKVTAITSIAVRVGVAGIT
jgi:hypothetical protein